tara:strand:- start:6235 stop:7176 length:942 start_codon:yes stop_codon:yes gene_type:complete
MKCIVDLSAEVPDTNTHYFRLKDFEDGDDGKTLFSGYNTITKVNNVGGNRIYLNVYSPTEFCQIRDHFGLTPMEHDNGFDKVFSICPYTCEWLNKEKNTDRYIPICYPFNEKDIPIECSKKYDVIYHGGIHGKDHSDCLKLMSKFNYQYLTMTQHINYLTQQHLPYATQVNLSNTEKLNVVAKSKISICYNYVNADQNHINAIKANSNWKNNIAFSGIESIGIIPQMKSRFMEAAFCRTINLVKKDPWNVVEHWFEPEKDFIYFEDQLDLESKINKILNNYDKYSSIMDSALNKCKRYSIQSLYDRIKTENIL